MNRHNAYSNGYRGSQSMKDSRPSISPHRFQPRSPAQKRRRQLLMRLSLGAIITICIICIFFPSLRGALIGLLSLGLFSDDGHEDFQLETVRYYDLSNSAGTSRGWEREERVLMCAPLRDAESHLPMFFAHLHNFTYPHHLIDLAFLVSDSKDNTLDLLSRLLNELQSHPNTKIPYGEISVIEKDFGQKVEQDVESRHGFAAQASRRKLMAQARNWLLSAALRPTHSWVYWRDADVETAPFTILEDLMRHNRDVIVPNVWRPLPDWLGGEQPYDLNSWQESETALALADTLDEDAVIVEGYSEYATWRPHLAYLRDPYGDPDMEMELDGVGGVSILAKAKVFRSGVHFPAFSFEKHAETEGFGKMAKRLKFSVYGLPHYTVWHLYEPSVDDIRHMEEMEQERRNQEQEEKERQDRAKKIKDEFGDIDGQWEKDKKVVEDMQKKDEQIKKEHEGAMAEKEKAQKGKDTKVSSKDVKDDEDIEDSTSNDSKSVEAGRGSTTKNSKGAKAGKDSTSKSPKNDKANKDSPSKDLKDANVGKHSTPKKTSKSKIEEEDHSDTKARDDDEVDSKQSIKTERVKNRDQRKGKEEDHS